MEQNPGPAIFDIIDSTTSVSADSSFFQLRTTVIEKSRFIYASISGGLRETGLSAIKLQNYFSLLPFLKRYSNFLNLKTQK